MISAIFPTGKCGVKEVIKVAFPLVAASIGHAINLFTDRIMLSAHSPQTMAAAFPAGLTAFTMSCIFLGAVGYAGVFVAQYTGAKEYKLVSLSVWQAIFLSLIGGAFMAVTTFWAEELFSWFGHTPEIQLLEVKYYRILACAGAVPLLNAAFSTFWSGRAKTQMIMIVNLLITLCNIPLNALLIFGVSFSIFNYQITIPEHGISGAAWGTVGAGLIGMLTYLFCFISPENRKKYGSLKHIFAFEVFRKLIRYGLPNGVQLVLDLATFNIFVVILGKISEPVLIASGVAFSTYSLSFNPMVGFGQTASIMVGQAIGAKDIQAAEKSVRSVRFMVLCYTIISCIFLIGFPEIVFKVFNLQDAEVKDLTRIMLIFTAGYLFFDAMNILYSNAVKGAGDTYFVMISGILLGWLAFALPGLGCYSFFHSQYVIELMGIISAKSWCVWTLWSICNIYIFLLALTFYIRYRQGKWKNMSII